MAIGPLTAQPCDLYREHCLINSATHTTNVDADDFRSNAVLALTPTRPTQAIDTAYAAQQTVDNWPTQLKQLNIQT